jgi:hypothetical protein
MTLLTYVNLSPLQCNPSRLHCITYSHCYTRLYYITRYGASGVAGGLQGERRVSCIGLPPADNTSSFPFNCVAGCDRNYVYSGNRWHKFVYRTCNIVQPSYWWYTCINALSERAKQFYAWRLNSPSSVFSSFNLRLSDSEIRVFVPWKTRCLRKWVHKISEEKNNLYTCDDVLAVEWLRIRF